MSLRTFMSGLVLLVAPPQGYAEDSQVRFSVDWRPLPFLRPRVAAWGEDRGAYARGKLDVPQDLSDVIAVAAGDHHSLALKSDGTVVGWGGPRVDPVNPAAVPVGLSGVASIACGTAHPLALKADGAVVGWGSPSFEGLGFPPDLSNVAAVSAQWHQTVVLLRDGSVRSWAPSARIPGQGVPVDLPPATAIAAGKTHALALLTDSTVRAWGANEYGQRDIPAGLSEVVGIAAGTQFSAFLKRDGTVVFSGSISSAPTGLSNVAAISAYGDHFVALHRDGTVGSWILGWNRWWASSGTDDFVGVTSISAGATHALGVVKETPYLEIPPNWMGRDLILTNTSDTAVTFTRVTVAGPSSANVLVSKPDSSPLTPLSLSAHGETGLLVQNYRHSKADYRASLRLQTSDPSAPLIEVLVFGGNISPSTAPKLLVQYPNDIQLVSGLGTVTAYGSNRYGQSTVPPGLKGIKAVAAGWGHSVALKNDGTVIAWGINDHGRQSTVPPGLSHVVKIAAGGDTTAAIREDGSVVAWGYNGYGQTNVPADLGPVEGISVGYDHVLALQNDGKLRAWGKNEEGQCTPPNSLPHLQAIAAGGDHSLALSERGGVIGWGDRRYGMSPLPKFSLPVTQVAAGRYHSLALLSNGRLRAWGDNRSLQRDMPDDAVPDIFDGWEPAEGKEIVWLGAGDDYSAVRYRDGSVFTWGRAMYPLGHIAAGSGGVQQVAAGSSHILMLRTALEWSVSNDRSPWLRTKLTNLGLTPLTIRNLSFQGPHADQFFCFPEVSERSESLVTVLAGQSIILELAHSHRLGGQKTSSLTIDSTDPSDGGSFILPLSVWDVPTTFMPASHGGSAIKGPLLQDRLACTKVQKLSLYAEYDYPNGFLVSIKKLPPGVSVLSGRRGEKPGEVLVEYPRSLLSGEKAELTLTYADPYDRLGRPSPQVSALDRDDPLEEPGEANGVIAPQPYTHWIENVPLLIFRADPRAVYSVEYSDDSSATWKSAAHRLRFSSGRGLWRDRGLPETMTKPSRARKYRLKKLTSADR